MQTDAIGGEHTQQARPEAATAASPLPDDAEALRASEDAAIAARRASALGIAQGGKHPQMQAPRVGLALSGGGIRSATFALGLLRGMAQSNPAAPATHTPANGTLTREGLLGRLDYLSTVSGGGYVGAMLGRLIDTYGIARAQALLASSDSPVLGWLRRNGRYLTPAGSRDTGIAIVTYARAWLAIHAEFMFACLMFGLLVVAPHLWQHSVQMLDAHGWERWYTPWWVVAVALWAAIAPGLIAGYWAARDNPDPTATGTLPAWRDLVFVALVGTAAWFLLRGLAAGDAIRPVRDALTWPAVGLLALTSVTLGQVLTIAWLAFERAPHALKVARMRNRLTRAQRFIMLVTVALAGIGALDRLSWWVLAEFQSGNRWLWGGVGAGSLAVVVLRRLVQPLQQIAAQSTGNPSRWLPRLLNIGSLFGLVVLLTAWMVFVQWFVFAPETFEALRGVPAGLRAALLAAVWIVWMLLSAGNTQMANTSSLHSFYRARLTRAWLAVGNRDRDLANAHGARADVTRVVEGDDCSLLHYRPEENGGPIHLVNTCLNQTRDDQSGLYNADRKGTALTASWRGFEIGAHDFIALRPTHDVGTLGRWVAVSGAAASPGAGAYTSRGLALLVYFLGVRLGHWMRAPAERVRLRWLSDLGWRFFTKPVMLASEASATFFGIERPWWYLSDGGHFENTGVYALLKRELDFIILSDAGCDARYEFGDLENLVRKARIDFGAEIDFYAREDAAKLFSLHSPDLTVLSPEDMANNHSCRGVLLARIRYRARPGPNGAPVRPEGTLLVIKPNLHDALDVDLLAYARTHAAFPHESTGDQSFDEAQWESYHRLGEDFGRALSNAWLAQLPGWRQPARHGLRVAARLAGTASGRDAAGAATEPLWRRNVRATAIGTTLGLGASGTLLLSMWQVQDQLLRERSDGQTEARMLFTEVSKGLQNFRGACPDVPEHVVTQTSLLLDLRDSPTMRPLEQAGVERLVERIGEECSTPVDATPECVVRYRRVQASLCALVRKPVTENTAFSYWHPGASPEDQVRDGRRVLQALAQRFPVFGLVAQQSPAQIAAADVDANEVVATPAPQVLTPGAPAAPVAAATPAPPPLPFPSVRPLQRVPTDLALAPTLSHCTRADGAITTLYIHIHEEYSRLAASALRLALQPPGGAPLIVAPIENVARSADLRQQRRPIPWPRPTLIVHDATSRDCARAIAAYIGAPWIGAQGANRVSVRNLSRSLPATPGVIELWLPPTEQLQAVRNAPVVE